MNHNISRQHLQPALTDFPSYCAIPANHASLAQEASSSHPHLVVRQAQARLSALLPFARLLHYLNRPETSRRLCETAMCAQDVDLLRARLLGARSGALGGKL